jgi:hypothetical protein
MPFPQWGDVPTWGLLAGAAITAWYARRAFKTQSKELTELKAEGVEQRRVNEQQLVVMELQQRDLDGSLRQRAADAAAARVAQASKVFVWTVRQPAGKRITSIGRDFCVSGEPITETTGGPSFAVYISNTSGAPIHDLVIRTDHGDNRNLLPILLPAAYAVLYESPEATWAVLDFRDAGRALWSRGGSGRLVDRGDDGEATDEVFNPPAARL